MRIRQGAAKCNLSALRRGLWWDRVGWGAVVWLVRACAGVSLVKWRCTQGDCLIYRQQEIKKTHERDRERVRVGVGGGTVERGGNLNVISKKWIKNLCGGTKRPIEGWFIAPGSGWGRGWATASGFTKLSCNTWQVFICTPQSERERERAEQRRASEEV